MVRRLRSLPGSEPDATYAYDLLGRMTSAVQNGITVAFTYDALGRQLTQTIPIALIANPVFTSEYDLAGRRTRLTWPVDASSPTAYYVDYDYLVTGDMWKVREKGATSGAGVLATYGYDQLGRRTSIARGNGASTSYGYDAVSRLSQMGHDFGGTTHDLTLTYAYNPASQIVSTTRSNDLYAWTGHGSGTTSSAADGKNQLATHGGASVTHDAKGNLTSDGTYNYTYTSENLLTSFSTSGLLEYDPLMRFYKNYGTHFIRDGEGAGQLLGEYYNGNISARYVPGAAMDEPVALVDKFGARRGYHADERGSSIAWSNDGGANAFVATYDEYGKRGPSGSHRFAHTGQVHLLGDVYDYKSRNYNARLGRFLQPDRIGYGDGMNLYAYVKGDPVNFTDPTGLCGVGEVAVARPRLHRPEGDVVALYRFICVRLLSDGADGGGVDGGVGRGVGPRKSIQTKAKCKLGKGAIDVSFDGTTITITANIDLVGPGADTSGAYIGGIAKAWTQSFGHINSIANISAGPGGVTADISSGIRPPGGARAWGNQMWLGNLGAMTDHQRSYATEHVGPHEFGHLFGIPNMPNVGEWAKSIMANSANDVSPTDLEAVVELCRAAAE